MENHETMENKKSLHVLLFIWLPQSIREINFSKFKEGGGFERGEGEDGEGVFPPVREGGGERGQSKRQCCYGEWLLRLHPIGIVGHVHRTKCRREGEGGKGGKGEGGGEGCEWKIILLLGWFWLGV